MAVTATLSNHYKYQLMAKKIDMSGDPITDTVKMILMASGYTFNKDTHATYSDVSASEHASGTGYTIGGHTLSVANEGTPLTEDDTNDRGSVIFEDETWTASGGSIVTPGAILYDDTTSDDTVIGYIDFGETITVTTGNSLTITGAEIRTS